MRYIRSYKLVASAFSPNEARRLLRQIRSSEDPVFTTPDRVGAYYVAFSTLAAASNFERKLVERSVGFEKRDALPPVVSSIRNDQKGSDTSVLEVAVDSAASMIIGSVIEAMFDW